MIDESEMQSRLFHVKNRNRELTSILTKSEARNRELLDALDRLRQQCDRLRLPGQQKTDAEKNADAVIAKATGETP